MRESRSLKSRRLRSKIIGIKNKLPHCAGACFDIYRPLFSPAIRVMRREIFRQRRIVRMCGREYWPLSPLSSLLGLISARLLVGDAQRVGGIRVPHSSRSCVFVFFAPEHLVLVASGARGAPLNKRTVRGYGALVTTGGEPGRRLRTNWTNRPLRGRPFLSDCAQSGGTRLPRGR